jgi:hypothetical protein
VGGGEDAVMFRTLIKQGARIRYRPDMRIEHLVDSWKLTRRYFLKLHYLAGVRYGRYRLEEYSRLVLGIPPFLIAQLFRQCLKTAILALQRNTNAFRQAMNAANAMGIMVGYAKRRRENRPR